MSRYCIWWGSGCSLMNKGKIAIDFSCLYLQIECSVEYVNEDNSCDLRAHSSCLHAWVRLFPLTLIHVPNLVNYSPVCDPKPCTRRLHCLLVLENSLHAEATRRPNYRWHLLLHNFSLARSHLRGWLMHFRRREISIKIIWFIIAKLQCSIKYPQNN